ncbi:transposase zinc-binding domain-containing protein [Vibrio maritimus]|uniref:transposase zinc-binding domain-containing protein n=1 Tax=Vibrio maritimus TaxID=990268 RepID=UPI003AF26773
MQQSWQRTMALDSTLRDIETIEIAGIFACGKPALDGKALHCENNDCLHAKNFWLTCSSHACSRCGEKATDNWIVRKVKRLPDYL